MSTTALYDTDTGNVDKKGPHVIPRSIKDPIHDMIPISPRLSMFIDTKQFQRLRNIKQLGTSYYVWLGASHNRLEHCIGVAFLARSMAAHLREKQPELGITERDIECVEIAGLCHDLGHGPWSHVWDDLFIPKALNGQAKWKHEDGSIMMFDALVKENDIPLSAKDDSFIKSLISGNPTTCSSDEKPFLFDIVANRRNGLDVDKFDYIPRDSHMIGDKMNIALPRIINSARVLDNQICYDIKDANLIYDICATRFKLHKTVYNHKAAKAIEYMIIDALLAADSHLQIAKQVFDPKKYLYLTDDIMPRIESSSEPQLSQARAIFDRIRNRDLYKMVDYKVVDWPWVEIFEKYITPDRIVAAAKASPAATEDVAISVVADTLRAEDVICDFSLMHYGMKEKNPLDFVKFYSKRHPNQSAKAERGVYSNLMPQYHAELLMRIFTKDADYLGIVQAGYRSCLAAIPEQLSDASEGMLSLQPLFPDTSTATSVDPLLGLAPALAAVAAGGAGAGAGVVVPRAIDMPLTPRSFSRATSFTLPGSQSADTTTPFSNNNFTTVAADYVPSTPSRGYRRASKRRREAESAGKSENAVASRGGGRSSPVCSDKRLKSA